VVPVPVAIETVDEPDDAVAPVRLVSNSASVAVAVTALPVATLERAILRASTASTELSAGTGSATAFAAVVGAVVTATALTVSAAVAAFAGTASTVPTSASAEAIAISGFLNEVMFVSPFICS
jgi:hypothetical protein